MMPKKPTVLVIVSDDQGFADVSWTGGVIPTPNLERIRNESTVLENFYVHPVCTPSRASLLTGKYAGHSAMTGPLLLAAPCKLKAEDKEATLATEMKRRGYYTSLSGKWHLGHHANEDTPTGHGFDDFHGVLNCVAYYSKNYFTPLSGHKKDWHKNADPVAPAPSEHSSALFADHLVEVIEEHGNEQPLFLMLSFTAPHSPLQSEPHHLELCAHVKTSRRQMFCGLMASVDEAVGKVVAAMKEKDLWDDSIVTYFNDNGGNVWEGGRNYPFRGGKMSSFEGGSRATGFVKFPVGSDAPRSIDGLTHVSDIMPTILSFVDRHVGGDSTQKQEQKKNRTHYALGKGYDILANQREDVLQHYDEATQKLGYRFGKWKIVSGAKGDTRRYHEPKSDAEWIGKGFHDYIAEMIMNFQHQFAEDASGSLDEMVRELIVEIKGWWKCLFSFANFEKMPQTLLFNLELDKYEDKDLSAQYPEVVDMMLERVEAIKKNFPPQNCNWFVGDSNVKYREVTFVDDNGDQITDLYHAPWVEDGAYGITYHPNLINIGPAKKIGSLAIFSIELTILFFFCSFLIKICGGRKMLSMIFGTSDMSKKKKRE